MTAAKQSITELYDLIQSRKSQPVSGSYTDYLFTKGLDKILKKVGEESTEVIVAAKNPDDAAFILEVADLTYQCWYSWSNAASPLIRLRLNWRAVKEK